MSDAVKAQAIVAAIKDVVKHKTDQLAAETDPVRKARAADHLKQAEADLVRAEAALAAFPTGEPVGAPVVAKA